jgi:hypothetical protein
VNVSFLDGYTFIGSIFGINHVVGSVGIGTLNPTSLLHLVSPTNVRGALATLDTYSANSLGSAIQFRKARGTTTGPSPVSSNDTLGVLEFSGWYQNGFTQGATISVSVDGNPGIANIPSRIDFSVSDGVNASTPLTIRSAGAIVDIGGVGAFMPPRITTAQRDALVPSNGMMIYNTDTNEFQGYKTSWVVLA